MRYRYYSSLTRQESLAQSLLALRSFEALHDPGGIHGQGPPLDVVDPSHPLLEGKVGLVGPLQLSVAERVEAIAVGVTLLAFEADPERGILSL